MADIHLDEPPISCRTLDGFIALVTLDRPGARNAIDRHLTRAIATIVGETEADPQVRAVVLTSSMDNVFCAGADLKEIAGGHASALATEDGGFAGFVRAKRAKPWIAAVSGAAYGGGCEIALSCDMIVASPESRFALPEVKRGLFAAAGGPMLLMRALPRPVALELLATGNPLSGERAFELGMANRLVASEAVRDEAIALARAMAANAPIAVRESLAIARGAAELDEHSYWRQSAAVMDRVFASEDAREGANAFLAKREPIWADR